MSAEVKPRGEALSFSTPTSLFQICAFPSSGAWRTEYDMTADGKRFLFACQSSDDKKPSITIAIQWLDMIKYPRHKEPRQQ